MAGPKKDRGSAFNWYRAALDRQSPPSMLMPPSMLLPMEARLAEFHLAKGDAQAAIDILIEGQTRHTHDVEILSRLRRALAQGGHKEQAAEVGRELERVRSE
jgi:predicted Zn-dependent protease